MKYSFLIAGLLLALYSKAQVNIVPMPAEVIESAEKTAFVLSPHTIIYIRHNAEQLRKYADELNDYLSESYGFKLKIEGNSVKERPVDVIELDLDSFEKTPEEAYQLNVRKKTISISGGTEKSIFYGIQTLKQILNQHTNLTQKNYPLSLHQLSIKDYPRFTYRGMHLDVSRHFFSVNDVKKYIDYLAYYKFNNFHWHLTDDQGWRIEIKKYPLLTSGGGCRAQTLIGPYGSNTYDGQKYCGYYTQEQIKEVVAYAKERFINIIPEIEMPGHALAALSSYPYLGCTKGPYQPMETWGVSDDIFCAGNDSTYTFIKNVLNEVTALFPSEYIHLGGDECPKERWKACPVCQQKIKEEHLKDENALQTYFMNRIADYLSSKGKKMIGWDEVLQPGLSKDAVIMSWTGEDGGTAAAKAGHDAIMTPGNYCYFDHSQSTNEDSVTFGGYTPLEKVYSYEPIPAAVPAEYSSHIIGAQANLWTEYISNMQKLEYMIFPRMAAMAEVLWSPKEKRNWTDFERRLPFIFADYKKRNINYSKAYYDLSVKTISTGNGIAWKLETKDPSAKIIYRVAEKNEKQYDQPVPVNESGTYTAYLADQNNKQVGSTLTQVFSLNKISGKKISLLNEPSSSYSGSGAFTLVDGIVNTKGMGRSSECLGFSGKDLEATIDAGGIISFSRAEINCFAQPASWIYPPASVEISISEDGTRFIIPPHVAVENNKGLYMIRLNTVKARYIRIRAKNAGTIPAGNPGAGNPAWLFVSELAVF